MPDRFVWTAADGATIELSDRAAGYIVQAEGTVGLRSPSYALTSSREAGRDGVRVTAVRAEPAEPRLALYVRAPSVEVFRRRARELVHALRATAGVGTLTVTDDWGETRSLSCYCLSGAEGDQAPSAGGLAGTWWRLVLRLYAPDPWWWGPEQTIAFGLAAPLPFLSASLPVPRTLSTSTVQGERTVALPLSDAPSFPVWTVTGPGSVLILTNVTTGEVVQVDAALGDGQTMVIDTRPGRQSVRRGDLPPTDPGANLGAYLATAPELWSLRDGVNVVRAQLGAAGATSRIDGRYRPRYAGV